MTAQELINDLMASDLPLDAEIMILDGFNGGGIPRTLNYGPVGQTITENHGQSAADCEDMVGQKVHTIGYGCY